MARRPEPVSSARLPQLYGDMVVRIHEFCICLIGQAQQGNMNGVLVEAERLMKQTEALVDLLNMKNKKNDYEKGSL